MKNVIQDGDLTLEQFESKFRSHYVALEAHIIKESKKLGHDLKDLNLPTLSERIRQEFEKLQNVKRIMAARQ